MTELELNKIKFTVTVLQVFHNNKKIFLSRLLEELNAKPVPETRFLKAHVRRMAQAEAKFLEMMEEYPADMYPCIEPHALVMTMIGYIDF